MPYKPQFATVKPYVLHFLRDNYWRVEDLLSYDDTLGEAQLQFWRTVSRLTRRGCIIENEKHMMALFRTSWSRHFTTLANKNSQQIKMVTITDPTYNYIEETIAGCTDNDGYVLSLIATAPDEIRQGIMLMLKLPTETLNVITTLVEKDLIDPANTIVCRLLGKPPQHCILQQMLSYLKD